ncbi:hypothetical protein JHU38_11635 [Prevotella sp. A2931]|uniref:Uncharacterized protein n=1 Tax=Prevotella illustrans TaxID=2800387 RepID=A0ABS3M8H3_9BACT|nr:MULTISPECIES: hypothetical protein [Prevotella]MBO1364405.1 hypothetical protein [Prevotella illustrans]
MKRGLLTTVTCYNLSVTDYTLVHRVQNPIPKSPRKKVNANNKNRKSLLQHSVFSRNRNVE